MIDDHSDFHFDLYPSGEVEQCKPLWFIWNPPATQGNMKFTAIVPGESSFIVGGPIMTVIGDKQALLWKPNIPGGTDVILCGGDVRKLGECVTVTVVQGQSPDFSCLTNSSSSLSTIAPSMNSSSSTFGSIGGVDGGVTDKGLLMGTAIGGIIGGLLTGLTCACVLFLCLRRYLGGNPERTHRVSQVSLLSGLIPLDAFHIDPYNLEVGGANETPINGGLQTPLVDSPPAYTA